MTRATLPHASRRHIVAAGARKAGRRCCAPRARSRGFLLLPVVLVIAVVAAVAFLMSRESSVEIRMAEAGFEGDAARYVAEAGLRHGLSRADGGACAGYGLPATAFGAHSYQAVFTPDSGSPVSVTATGTLASGASGSLRRDGVRIHQPPFTLTLQPDAVTGEDTRLYEKHSLWNFGSNPDLPVEGKGGSRSHSLIRFDLSAIPASARITGATLELFQNAPGRNGTVLVHRVTRGWVEGNGSGNGPTGAGATWNEAEPGIPWTAPGGDFDPLELAAATIPSGVIGPFQWDVSALVSGWHTGAYPNHGLLLRPTGSSHSVVFSSSDATAAPRPKLTIDYACECGAVCLPPPSHCDADFTPENKVSEFSTAGQSYRYNRGITYVPEGWEFAGATVPAGGIWVTVGDSGRLVVLDMDGNVVHDSFDTGLSGFEGIAFVPAGAEAGHFALVDDDILYYVDTDLSPAGSYTTHALPFVNSAGGITYIDGGAYDGHLAIADNGDQVIHIVDQSLTLITTLATSGILGAPEGIAHLRNTNKFLVADKSLDAALVIDTDLAVSQSYDLISFGYGEPASAAIHPDRCDHVIGDHGNDRYASLNVGASVLEVRVAASSDDAEELAVTNGVDLDSSDLELAEDSGFGQRVGMRFTDITVPAGATVTSAWIQFKVDEKSTGSASLNVQGEARDDAPAFTATSSDISSRALTSASISWSPPNWTTVGEAGPAQRTPDIAAVIQEIVNRPGWSSGNAIVVIISGSGTRTAESFDGNAPGAPFLHIEF